MSNESYYDELLEKTDIEEVATDLLSISKLNKKGVSLTGDCPTGHDSDGHKCFVVTKNQGLFHCFNCGIGGNAIQLIEQVKFGTITKGDISDSFIQARDILADYVGMPLLENEGLSQEEIEKKEKIRKEKSVVSAILKDAFTFYNKQLTKDHRKFLLDTYGITEETTDSLLIGYATGKVGQHLMTEKGWKLEDILLSGLFLKFGNDLKKIQPFFVERYVFPYWKHGSIVYSIGRKTDKTPDNNFEDGKYKKHFTRNEKNSYISETIKNEHFYYEDAVRGQKSILITEGVTDCILANQAGFPCISPVTVRFRKDDVSKLIKLTEKIDTIYICNDNEENQAGDGGAWDTAIELEKAGKNVKLIELPRPEGVKKVDLNDYLRTHPSDDFKKLMKRAKNPLSISIDKLDKEESPEDIARNLEPILNILSDKYESVQDIYLKQIKENLGKYADLNILKKQLKEIKKNKMEEETRKQEEEEAKRKAEAKLKRQEELLKIESNLTLIHAALDEITSSPSSHDIIELALASYISLTLSLKTSESIIWLLVVGSPSSDKTATINGLREAADVYFLDTLTENAFISGYVKEGEKNKNKDLLGELDRKILIIKDLTTIFSMHHDTVKKILGDMQSIYDGSLTKFMGTRGKVEYNAKFSILACITPLALDEHQNFMSTIGGRFLFYQLPELNDEQEKDGCNITRENQGRTANINHFQELVASYALKLRGDVISAEIEKETDEQWKEMIELSKLLACGRTAVRIERIEGTNEDGKRYVSYDITDTQKEEIWRGLQQIRTLAKALVIVHKRKSINQHELDLVRKVILSSIPSERMGILRLFSKKKDGITRKYCMDNIGKGYTYIKRVLTELKTIGMIREVVPEVKSTLADLVDNKKTVKDKKEANLYFLEDKFKSVLEKEDKNLDHVEDLF